MLRGYARVSTSDQSLDGQLDVLTAAGCAVIYREHASGADRSRPELARALAAIGKGDTLVVAKLDRVARSQIHLLEVVRDLDKRGAFFKSLGDPIDTGSLQGRLMFGMLAAFAEFERGLIAERTRAGLAAARARGRIGGNPKLRTEAGRAEMAALRAARRAPASPDQSPATAPHTPAVAVCAGLLRANPQMTLRALGAELRAVGVLPPGGAGAWAVSSVAGLRDAARAVGLLDTPNTPASGLPAGVSEAAD